MAFYQKYRSQKFSDLIGQDQISNTLIAAVKSDRFSHAYLLAGPRGTGKTSTARLLAKAINCQKVLEDKKTGRETTGENCNECESCNEITEGRAVDVIEIDAASHTGVDDIRDLIDKARFSPVKAAKKVYIIDEVHMLSKSAFNALLKTLEEPPSHVVFILATTEPHKLPATILSRVQRYDFKRVSKDDIIKNLQRVAKAEEIKISDEALEILALAAEGGHRDALGLLEQVSSFSKDIAKTDVENILGIARSEDLGDMVGAIFNNNPEEGLKIAHRLYENGSDMANFIKSLVEYLRRILLVKMSGSGLFEDTEENIQKITELSRQVEQIKLIKLIELFMEAGHLLKDISYPLLPVEMAVIESCGQLSKHQEDREESTFNVISTPQELRVEKSSASQKISRQARDDNETTTSPKVVLTEMNTTEIAPVKPVEITEVKPEETLPMVSAEPQVPIIKEEVESAVVQPATSDIAPAANASAPVLEMKPDIWEQLIMETKKGNTTLAALLRDAKPLKMDKDSITLGVKFKFHKDKISEHKNCLIIESALANLLGKKVQLHCELLNKEKKEVKADAADLSKAAEEIFG